MLIQTSPLPCPKQRLDATLRRTDATLENFAKLGRPEILQAKVRSKFQAEINAALAAHRQKFPEMSAFRIIDA